MTYYIIVIGCQMNKADSERLAAYLESYGYRLARSPKVADIVAITTCGVRQSAEDRVYGLVNQIKKDNRKALLIITGCLSERADVKRRLKDKIDIWLPIVELPQLMEKIETISSKKSQLLASQASCRDYLSIAPKYSSSLTAFVPIGNGCNNFCAYCVVPYARGREVYRSATEIISEVRRLIKNGYKEINLIAQNVNSYHSGRVGFPQLLKKVNALPGNFWIRFFSSHPKDMSPELIKVMAQSKKVCEHIHLAVQSGDDQILKAMNRKYTAAHYKRLIKSFRKALDGRIGVPAAVSTDVIVGFPGETRQQFLQSAKLFKDLKFDMAYLAQYSPRFGTVAAKMKDNVSRSEKKRREEELNEILKKTAGACNQEYLNKTVEVLITGQNKRGQLYGQTRTLKGVQILGASDKKLVGRFVLVTIKKAQAFGLAGVLYEKKFGQKTK